MGLPGRCRPCCFFCVSRVTDHLSRMLKIRLELTEDSLHELLGPSGAGHADDYRSPIRLRHQLECQERAALPFSHNHFRDHRNALAVAGNAESIAIREFLSLDDSSPKLGQERCLALA